VVVVVAAAAAVAVAVESVLTPARHCLCRRLFSDTLLDAAVADLVGVARAPLAADIATVVTVESALHCAYSQRSCSATVAAASSANSQQHQQATCVEHEQKKHRRVH
jgi:hypothetical protein